MRRHAVRPSATNPTIFIVVIEAEADDLCFQRSSWRLSLVAGRVGEGGAVILTTGTFLAA